MLCKKALSPAQAPSVSVQMVAYVSGRLRPPVGLSLWRPAEPRPASLPYSDILLSGLVHRRQFFAPRAAPRPDDAARPYSSPPREQLTRAPTLAGAAARAAPAHR